jgi:cysteinyl-tRNA synthetase
MKGYFMKKIMTLLLFITLSTPTWAKRADISWVQSWAYWLQDIEIEELKENSSDLVVIDYSKDGTEDTAFSSEDIATLQSEGKIVLAYLSIGEAEDYRFYWQSSWREGKPKFIEKENEEWRGNYKVKYWHKGWWDKVIQPYMDKILSAGFDGVYLDIVDAYYYFGEKDDKMTTRARQMVKLVEKIAQYGRENYGEEFIITPQNGTSILDDSSRKYKGRYIEAIDAIGVESVFYNTYSQEDKAYRLEKLDELDAHHKLILNVEYINESKYDEYFDTWENSELHIIGYPAHEDTALDELITPYE